ncbi:MAG: hypothetical protein JWP42_2406 [Pseudomonas sp.]|nr:hypothetical protein [Pseudomonas sp.]
MNTPFAVGDTGQVFISQADIRDGIAAKILVSGASVDLPDGWAERSAAAAVEKADLLERRLEKLEAFMNQTLAADEEVRLHAVKMQRFIEGLSAAGPK